MNAFHADLGPQTKLGSLIVSPRERTPFSILVSTQRPGHPRSISGITYTPRGRHPNPSSLNPRWAARGEEGRHHLSGTQPLGSALADASSLWNPPKELDPGGPLSLLSHDVPSEEPAMLKLRLIFLLLLLGLTTKFLLPYSPGSGLTCACAWEALAA